MKYEIDRCFRVIDVAEGVVLEVIPHPDNPKGSLMLRSGRDGQSKEYYGNVEITFADLEHARVVAKAIIEAADAINSNVSRG